MSDDCLNKLWLLHLSDSALPIGLASHSFGLESVVEDGWLNVDNLPRFLGDYLSESGRLEAAFCCLAWNLEIDSPHFATKWCDLNDRMSAFKPSREMRSASATLGRRLLALAFDMIGNVGIQEAQSIAGENDILIHHSTAFGLLGSILNLDAELTAGAWLHQSAAGMISACQRLLPLGQVRASKILANLKPQIAAIASSAANCELDESQLFAFNPLLELASMRHPALRTRLFIS